MFCSDGSNTIRPFLVLSVAVASQSHSLKSVSEHTQLVLSSGTTWAYGMEVMLKTSSRFDEKKMIFQLLFLKEDSDQSVKVEEVENVNFGKIRKHLLEGESVFIVSKNNIATDRRDLPMKKRRLRVTRKHRCASPASFSFLPYRRRDIVLEMHTHRPVKVRFRI